MPELAVKNLDVFYGPRQILHAVNFHVESGAIYGVLGPNGSGKTTLIKAMSGVVRPRAGEIHLNGDRLDRMPHQKLARTVAVVPQITRIEFSFTAFEVAAMGRNPYQGRIGFDSIEDEKIVVESMKDTDCLHLKDRVFNELSGGEAQRVILARCLAQKCRLLLLDEPTSHLDIKYQSEIFHLLRRLRRDREITILISTHDLNLAAMFCDRVLLIKDGQRAAEGQPAAVITDESVRSVFSASVQVTLDPQRGTPFVTPLF